jgi:peptide subunit release factor 1 (eRF1)
MLALRYKLSRIRLLHLLKELKSNSIEVGSLCLPPRPSPAGVKNVLEELVDTKSLHQDIANSVVESPTGAILFWGPHHRYLVMPPFPMKDERFSKTCEIEPLYSLLQREFLFGLVVVRLGAYGIGVVKGETLISSKVGTGLVHSRHRQGGSSSHRFERHRLKQMETFFTNVCEHTREQLEPYSRQLEYLIYGGTRQTLLDFRKQCHFLHQFDTRTIDILLNIREPKHSGIEEAIQEAWSSRVIEWNE